MDLNKYSELREKIKSQDFETKNKDIDTTLNVFSYIGNIGSIFFAFFLLFPALHKAISANLLGGEISSYLAGFITILVLSGFELLKRKVLGNLSFDIIKNRLKLQRSLISWFVFSIAIITASFYFSLKGAINFASTSKEENYVVEITYQNEIDSINSVYNKRKQVLIDDNISYRESNKIYRDKIANTPINYRTVRNDYQNLIDSNNKIINENDKRISDLDNELSNIVATIKNEQNEKEYENENNDLDNILLFLVLSTSIEFIIILGIYFDKYYDYNVYLMRSNDLELKYKKRDRYIKLVKFIYKEGSVGIDQAIIGKSKLIELVKDKTTIPSVNKFVNDFFDDTDYLGIFKLNGKRRYTKIPYEDAIEKISNMDDSLKLIEELN